MAEARGAGAGPIAPPPAAPPLPGILASSHFRVLLQAPPRQRWRRPFLASTRRCANYRCAVEHPADEALRYVTSLANLKFKVEPFAVAVVPQNVDTTVLITRMESEAGLLSVPPAAEAIPMHYSRASDRCDPRRHLDHWPANAMDY